MSWNLYLGDCLETMREFNEACVDSIVTDPPYGLEFMGEEWDQGVPGVPFWKEALRVLKPGGHLLAFGGTRKFHRLACAVEDAGFEIRDCVMWIHSLGFPKSHDVSKAIDKIMDVDFEKELEIAAYLKARREELGLSKKTVDDFVFGGTSRYSFVEGRNDPTGAGRVYLPTPSEWVRLKEVLRLDGRFDGYISKAIPERHLRHRVDGGKGVLVGEESGDWGYQKDGNRWDGVRRVTDLATDDARKWEGWGTALKPAWEPVILARKPFKGTVARNVLEHGTGVLNIDGCRIPTQESLNGGGYSKGESKGMWTPGQDGGGLGRLPGQFKQPSGRWPANLIFDEGAARMLDEQTGDLRGRGNKGPAKGGGGLYGHGECVNDFGPGELTGGASRFFYCAKASQKERDAGLADQKNNHPTVKPVALMAYLCRLITQPGGVVLDPFMGSGSTGIGAIREGFNFIGVEMQGEYVQIAEARLAHAMRELEEQKEVA